MTHRSLPWTAVLLLTVMGCMSAWETHQSQLREYAANGEWTRAVGQARWLADNAPYSAPEAERTSEADAARQLRLAELAGKAGNTKVAVEALREALTLDPQQAAAVRAQLDALPLSPSESAHLKREFAWNTAVLAPGNDVPQVDSDLPNCWSYRVHEVRIRHRWTLRTPGGLERRLSYDARPWVFDAGKGRWSPEGKWVSDAGTESELIDGLAQPRYRAMAAADHSFYADEGIPPCHRTAWAGPYDTDGRVFVAAQLPAIRAAVSP